VEYKRGEYLEFEKFDDYWDEGKPYLEGVKWVFIPDSVTAQMSFEAGEGDIIYLIGKPHVLLHDLVPKGYIADTGPGMLKVLVPSSGHPDSPLANMKVRQAVDYAINKEKICESIYFGYAEPVYQNVISPQTPLDPSFEGARKYDPDKARQLLEEAGYPDGFSTTLYSPQQLHGDEELAIQADLKAVNIDVALEVITPGRMIEMWMMGWEDGFLVAPHGSMDFGMSLERWFIRPTEPNVSRGVYWDALYRPDEIENAIQEYLLIPEWEQQVAKAKNILNLITDQAMIIPISMGVTAHVMQTNVHGTPWGDLSFSRPEDLKGVWISSD
jgi:peptide/nickel transport system substrate-binding protein